MARLYADEDFDAQAVEELRLRGHDVLTVQEAGQGGQSIDDAGVLAFAISHDRAVLTFNRRDFRRLHRRPRHHTGIIICTRDPDAAALAARIDATLAGSLDLKDQLLRVIRPSS